MGPEQRDPARIDQILTMIDHLRRRIGRLPLDRFEHDRDEIDLTAYRIAVIGEESSKLSASLKARHPELPWKQIYRMRHIISHDYAAIAPHILWRTVMSDLDSLEAACRQERGLP